MTKRSISSITGPNGCSTTRLASDAGIMRNPFLLQTYRRDTGEVMHDISAPVMVKGRHWEDSGSATRPRYEPLQLAVGMVLAAMMD